MFCLRQMDEICLAVFTRISFASANMKCTSSHESSIGGSGGRENMCQLKDRVRRATHVESPTRANDANVSGRDRGVTMHRSRHNR